MPMPGTLGARLRAIGADEISKPGSRASALPQAAYNSNWGTTSDTDVDAYMIHIPVSAIP